MKPYWIKRLERYCEINNDRNLTWEEKSDLFGQEFGDADIDLEDLLNELPKEYAWTEAGSFDSPGYDMSSYAVAWIQDGELKIVPLVVAVW